MLQFEWDPAKRGEIRWQAIGLAGGLAVLLVAHTFRKDGEVIRLISARLATRKERIRYETNRAQDFE